MNNNNIENKVANAPLLRFPEFKDEWTETTLNDIADFSKGQGISKDQRSEDGTPCILYGELYTTYSSEIIDKVVSKTDIDPTKLVKSKANDIIIPASGETAIDIATARCVKNDNVLLGGDLNIIRMKDKKNLGEFFSYELNGIRRYDIAQIAQGVSVVHLHASDLKGLNVRVPSFQEQRKIADFLSLLDKRIELQKSAIEKLKSLMAGICTKISIENTPNTKIKDCLNCESTTLKESDLQKQGDYPVYGANGLCGFTDNADCCNESILIVKDGSGVGSLQYVDGKYSFIGTLNRLKINKGFYLKYLYFVLSAFDFSKFKTGMAIPHIYYKDYGNSMIYCPSYDKQQEIAHKLTTLETKIKRESDLLSLYQKQKRYLLSKMFI